MRVSQKINNNRRGKIMTNIQTTAIRLIVNAFLYSREKGKECVGYRFDSSFLTKRNITSIADMEELQKELNKRGWCFNILSFNDFVIQEKSFLAEMTKLGFGRIEDKSDSELAMETITSQNDKAVKKLNEYIQEKFKSVNLSPMFVNTKLVGKDNNPDELSIEKRIDIGVRYYNYLYVKTDLHGTTITGFNKTTHNHFVNITSNIKKFMEDIAIKCAWAILCEKKANEIMKMLDSFMKENKKALALDCTVDWNLEDLDAIPFFRIYCNDFGDGTSFDFSKATELFMVYYDSHYDGILVDYWDKEEKLHHKMPKDADFVEFKYRVEKALGIANC